MKKESNVIYLFEPNPKPKPVRPLKVKKLADHILKQPAQGMFAMTWDKHGQVTFYNTHGDASRDLVRSRLMDYLLLTGHWSLEEIDI